MPPDPRFRGARAAHPSADSTRTALTTHWGRPVLLALALLALAACKRQQIVTEANVSLPDRESVARMYLRGAGLEIGALNLPQKVPFGTKVTYVDILTTEQLRTRYPEIDPATIHPVDVVDDGERLAKFGAGSQSFVIANHFLEHCQDPIGALENILRVLKPGGILQLGIPDKRYTFDVDRPVTPYDHLLRDHQEGPAGSREAHYREWVTLVNKVTDPSAVDAEVARLMSMNDSIHFHAWTPADLLELFSRLQRDLRLPFNVELFYQHETEIIAVLKKTA